jgi:hypothetical protein
VAGRLKKAKHLCKHLATNGQCRNRVDQGHGRYVTCLKHRSHESAVLERLSIAALPAVDATTGEPTAVDVACVDDMNEEEAAAMERLGARGVAHRWSQEDWQPVRDQLLGWAKRCLFIERDA